MQRYLRFATLFLVSFCILSVFETGCAGRPLLKPMGEHIGSCKGVIKLSNGPKARFKVELYKESDGDFNAYLTMIRKGVRNALIEDISFDNETISFELSSSHKMYEGSITGNSLKFDGAWGGFSGALKLKLDN
ncbi:hypothetical protein ACFL47_10675 [Candidatus Latescibacterota bacterium]